jgi:fructose transport system ATP-binding protein
MGTQEKEIILESRDLCKFYGGVRANDNVNIKLYKDEILAIVGDNGAGKSTFIKMISGMVQKTSGEILINGQKAEINNPIDARKCGIETVYQDGGIIPIFNASRNLFLGREKVQSNILGKVFQILDYKYMKNETLKALGNIGINLKDSDTPISSLSGGERQTVVVGRAVYWGGKILIFDEPTNNLGVKQEKIVMDTIKKIKNELKISMIIISHNINHVMELADRIVIFLNGKVVGERIKKDTNHNEIVSLITGINS